MKKIVAALALAALLGGTAWFNNRAPAAQEAPAVPHTETLTIVGKNGQKHVFNVEIAATTPDRERGLMFRDKMDPDHGMLFEMDHDAVVYFWMKNTFIPLDILFIAKDGTIRHIHENAVPQSLAPIGSKTSVTGVLELNGGRSKTLGIAEGDKVEHPYFSNVSR